MPREPLPTWFYVLVAVRLGRRFLLVREAKHGARWYLPAGRVEPGESLVAAAERETLEEAGIPISVDGIVRVGARFHLFPRDRRRHRRVGAGA